MRDRSVKAVAAAYGCSWNTCHAAVVVLGLDESRRGKAKWEVCAETGERSWVGRWDTGLVDITGNQGLLVQVNGRASKSVTAWLDERGEAWKAGIDYVTIDMSAVYAKAVRQGLPGARLVVDRFHLVETGRAAALAPWIEYCNTRRRHTALGGLPPTSRLLPT